MHIDKLKPLREQPFIVRYFATLLEHFPIISNCPINVGKHPQLAYDISNTAEVEQFAQSPWERREHSPG